MDHTATLDVAVDKFGLDPTSISHHTRSETSLSMRVGGMHGGAWGTWLL
jgi:hypothetical protein